MGHHTLPELYALISVSAADAAEYILNACGERARALLKLTS